MRRRAAALAAVGVLAVAPAATSCDPPPLPPACYWSGRPPLLPVQQITCTDSDQYHTAQVIYPLVHVVFVPAPGWPYYRPTP